MEQPAIEVHSYKRVDLVTISGRIDSSNVSTLDTALKSLADNGRYNLVLDLSGVDYMSSAGLRAMVSSLRTNKKHNGDLRLTTPSKRVQEVLSLAGLDSLFEVYDDHVSAVGSY